MARDPVGQVGAAARGYFRNRAFWATGVFAEDVLADAKAVLYRALDGSRPLEAVLADLDEAMGGWLPEFDAAGRVVNVPHRLETIARTNVADAINAGRDAVFSDPELGGFVEGFQYSAVLDDRVRPNHAAWDGVAREAEFWEGPPDRRPPTGFNCRCLLLPVTAADGVEWTPDDDLPDEELPDEGFR